MKLTVSNACERVNTLKRTYYHVRVYQMLHHHSVVLVVIANEVLVVVPSHWGKYVIESSVYVQLQCHGKDIYVQKT